MSKLNIPIYNFNDNECNTLFKSINEKLNIQNPHFFYPIYKKIIDENTTTPETLRGIVIDSKFKCKEILTKILDEDSEGFETEDDADENNSADISPNTNTHEFTFKTDNITNPQSHLQFHSQDYQTDIDVNDILNNNIDIDLGESSNGDEDEENTDDDLEIEEAIRNTFTATGLVERINKQTGEKIVKEEKIHIKKTPLLEPLKVMKDEFIIPARIKNKNLEDENIKNTNNKINSYNNSAHVEALFLYLANKLVETGKCPSFPYYYGCINGEDPNYHHNITDEYESVSRTKWFRNRIKNDFDLLIIEGDEIDEMQQDLQNRLMRRTSGTRSPLSPSALTNSDSEYDESNDEENASEGEEDINDDEEVDADSENSETDKEFDNADAKEPQKGGDIIPIDNIDNTLNNILQELQDKDNIGNSIDGNFIKSMDDEDLEIVITDDTTLEPENNHNQETNGKKENGDNKNGNNDSKSVDGGDGDGDGDVEDDFIDELSDIDPDNLSLSEFENTRNNYYYVKCESMPVNLCLMEKLDQTLDDLLDDGYNMGETEWFSMFFQVAFGLAIAQKYFNFVHNDLHSSNVMFKETKLKFVYFQIGNTYYKIPTFGKLTKIIDFARGTFKLGDRWIFSDQFKEDGDAWGQYDYPTDGTLKNCENKPNPSFDLVRLGTTVIQRLDEVPRVREFVESITKDDYDNCLCYDEDTFQLYIDIAHNCHNAVPIEVLGRPEFERFKIPREKLPKSTYIFKY